MSFMSFFVLLSFCPFRPFRPLCSRIQARFNPTRLAQKSKKKYYLISNTTLTGLLLDKWIAFNCPVLLLFQEYVPSHPPHL